MIRLLRQKRVVVAIIPKGCTMYVQTLDVFIFSVFRRHYDDVADEFIEKNGPRGQFKLTASESRILCTRLTWFAWLRTLKSIDFEKFFQDLGDIWVDDSVVSYLPTPYLALLSILFLSTIRFRLLPTGMATKKRIVSKQLLLRSRSNRRISRLIRNSIV
jgi:hypothetical protein